jgi:hypothetical protein
MMRMIHWLTYSGFSVIPPCPGSFRRLVRTPYTAGPSFSLPTSRSTTRLHAHDASSYVNVWGTADLGNGGATRSRIRAAIWLLW